MGRRQGGSCVGVESAARRDEREHRQARRGAPLTGTEGRETQGAGGLLVGDKNGNCDVKVGSLNRDPIKLLRVGRLTFKDVGL